MAQHYWHTQRAFIMQDLCFDADITLITHPGRQKEMALYIRYQNSHNRAFHQCRQELEKMQAARKAEPVKQETAEVRLAIAKVKRELTVVRVEKSQKKEVRIEKSATVADSIPSAA